MMEGVEKGYRDGQLRNTVRNKFIETKSDFWLDSGKQFKETKHSVNDTIVASCVDCSMYICILY